MALTSTSFMAAPGGFGSTLSSKLDKIDCSQVLSAVLKADKQLLGHIKMGPTATNIEVNWIEDELTAAYVLASGSANNRITITGGNTLASLQRMMRANAILQPSNGECVMRLTQAVAASTAITVAVYGSTTWASWTSTRVYVLAQPFADMDDASSDISSARGKRKNFMQVFERAVQIEKTRQNMDMEAVSSELQLQIKYRTLEVKRELDMSVIRGYAKASGSSGYTGDSELRTMAGIIQLIRDYDLDTSNEDSTVINKASAALTIAGLNSLAYKIYDAGGLDETADPILLVGPEQARVIASFEAYLRRVEQGERTVGYYRNVFLSDMGVEMPVVLDRWMPRDKVILLDRSRIFIRPMKGDDWGLEKMAKSGRNDKWQLSGQFTLDMRNANACHGMIYNLAG
jgi:hypothetical protein